MVNPYPQRLVMIRWVDSHTNQGWELIRDAAPYKTMRIHSVGWIVFENKEVVVIAPHLCVTQYCDTMTIPRVSIEKITVIR